MTSLLIARASIASIWLYQGLWSKLLGNTPHHREMVRMVPFLSHRVASWALIALGCVECALGIWVLSGVWASGAALAQTILLSSMNIGGLVWASRLIPDPVGMLLQNTAFLLLAWMVAGELSLNAAV